ncbi:hypothetical protein D3C75_1132260 [compost metagenome]
MRAVDQVAGMLVTDVEALRGFADHLIGDAVHLKTFWPNGVDVAVVLWPSLLHFFRHDFVLAAIAADIEWRGVIQTRAEDMDQKGE